MAKVTSWVGTSTGCSGLHAAPVLLSPGWEETRSASDGLQASRLGTHRHEGCAQGTASVHTWTQTDSGPEWTEAAAAADLQRTWRMAWAHRHGGLRGPPVQ
jgi:hypothetical protein